MGPCTREELEKTMEIWLEANRKAQPNDHVARALFDQFTLGPGHASENAVREAARAFTGWFVLRGRLHLFYQTYGNGRRDAICHAWSDDGLNFTRDLSNPVFRPTGDWNCGRPQSAPACSGTSDTDSAAKPDRRERTPWPARSAGTAGTCHES